MQPLEEGNEFGVQLQGGRPYTQYIPSLTANLERPQKETWSWTSPNRTVGAAIENLLYWRPNFQKYFASQNPAVVLNAYRSTAGKYYGVMFDERIGIELLKGPLNLTSKKLVLFIVVSITGGDRQAGEAEKVSYRASASEEDVFPVPANYTRITEGMINDRSYAGNHFEQLVLYLVRNSIRQYLRQNFYKVY